MSYLFTCPHCQTKTRVDERYSGQSGECAVCGGPIELPHFAVGATELPAGASSRANPKRIKLARWLVTTLVAVILFGTLLVAAVRFGGQTVGRLNASRERAGTLSNLKAIAAALNAYAADHGSYPPPALMDDNNQPLVSWRVLILPYLGEEELYDQYDRSLRWDDPQNMQLAYQMPAVFRHPASPGGGLPETSYYLVTGSGTLFPPETPKGPRDVVDDPSQTILVIEGRPAINSGLWTEPIDLDFAAMRGRLGSQSPTEPGGVLDEGVAFATVDGRAHYLPDQTSPDVIRALVTPAGGEPLADDTLD